VGVWLDSSVQNSLQTLGDVLSGADQRLLAGQSAAAQVWSTGFPALDSQLGGGLRAGELTLLGGPQGLGKTTFALQLLRNAVVDGGVGLYFSFEHDSITMLERLIALEAGESLGLDGLTLARVRSALQVEDAGSGSLAQRLTGLPGGTDAAAAVASYADRLHLHRSTGKDTDLATIQSTIEGVAARGQGRPVVVVDYLQKVPVPGSTESEEERVTVVVEALKDMALALEVPVFAIVAADKAGLVAGKRLRIGQLRGSSALAYEPDVVLILNDKFDVVARHHLVFDVGNAERFRSWVVLSIEKNRGGLDKIDLEFRKRFEQSRFEVGGQAVEEQLVDERVYVE
jgi:replicative DNA helicase